VGVESPSGGCNGSSKLSCGVEELKSSVDIVAKICEASMEEGRACPSGLHQHQQQQPHPVDCRRGAQGIPNSI